MGSSRAKRVKIVVVAVVFIFCQNNKNNTKIDAYKVEGDLSIVVITNRGKANQKRYNGIK